jgi:hypothetical protein
MDFLADGILDSGHAPEGFTSDAKEGYLAEVLRAIRDPQDKLSDAIDAVDAIDEILSRMDYGQLRKDDANRLEDLVQTLIGELEIFFT